MLVLCESERGRRRDLLLIRPGHCRDKYVQRQCALYRSVTISRGTIYNTAENVKTSPPVGAFFLPILFPHCAHSDLAGINITAFITTMLEERRLDIVIYESILKHLPAGQQLPDDRLNDETLVAAGVAALNEVYGESAPNIIARGVLGKLVPWRRDSLGWLCGRVSPSNTILHDGCSV